MWRKGRNLNKLRRFWFVDRAPLLSPVYYGAIDFRAGWSIRPTRLDNAWPSQNFGQVVFVCDLRYTGIILHKSLNNLCRQLRIPDTNAGSTSRRSQQSTVKSQKGRFLEKPMRVIEMLTRSSDNRSKIEHIEHRTSPEKALRLVPIFPPCCGTRVYISGATRSHSLLVLSQ